MQLADDTDKAFYEYLLVYTDDLLAIAKNPQTILDDVNVYFNLKPESVQQPTIYLGSKVSKAQMANEVKCWCNSSHQYAKKAIKDTETYLRKHQGKMLRHRCFHQWRQTINRN
jgi:hypothetical protein